MVEQEGFELSTPYVANVVLATEFANSWLSNLGDCVAIDPRIDFCHI